MTCGVLLACPAAAQDGFALRPSISAVEVHDSNLFAAPSDRQTDVITRVRPAIQSEYRSTLWSVDAGYAFDIERFDRHPELSSADARRDATIGLQYRPTRRLTLAAGAGFAKTHSPSDLNTVAGLVFARARAQRISAHSSITTQLHRPTAGRLDYEFSEDRLAGANRIRSHAATMGLDRRLASRDKLTLESRIHQFEFQSPELERSAATSLALVVGWTHSIARDTSLSIDAGPRATNGAFAPELSAQIRLHRASRDLSFTYARTQAPIIGLPGTAATHSVAGAAGWRFGRTLEVLLSPSFVRSTLAARRGDSYRLTIDVTRPIVKGLAVAFAGTAGVQHGNLQTGRASETISRHEIMIKLIAERMRREPPTDAP